MDSTDGVRGEHAERGAVCDRLFSVFRRHVRMTSFPMLNGLFEFPDPCVHMRSLAGLQADCSAASALVRSAPT